MPYFKRGNARIYFLEQGSGFPVITLHGLIGNTAYWRLSGIADQLAREYQVISMDMRAHGNTRVSGEPAGYNAETVAQDMIALADHLGFHRFHVLSHSAGGFAAVRHAMEDSSRFASLVLTNSASSTFPSAGDAGEFENWHEALARSFEAQSWDAVLERLRETPGPFFRGIVESDRCEALLATAYEMLRQNNRHEVAAFVRRFCTDPDPCREGLARVDCPTLVVCGEKDELFAEPSRLMAECIPGAELLAYEGVGHMSGIEAPDRLAADILGFFRRVHKAESGFRAMIS
jgi:pimeloyl-ACP methyl ester carboxylesterase